jgi:hypothetical protein
MPRSATPQYPDGIEFRDTDIRGGPPSEVMRGPRTWTDRLIIVVVVSEGR